MKVTNLNAIVKDMSKMLSRMIGEDVALDLDVSNRTSNILADPSQVEQILMNLAVNARDAMPQGGSFNVEISDVELDEKFTRDHEGSTMGSFVRLRVKDTGEGMEPGDQEKIFEPFYTTKEKGKGTGLGLATVYGIVKQHKGYIYVSSEIGSGTTFDTYLPVVQSKTKAEINVDQQNITHRSETVLVVEDEPTIRMLICSILTPLGFNILEAGDGFEALEASANYKGEINLVLTDVIMPRMNGHEFVERLQQSRPSTKVIFMSGYTDDVIAKHGVLEPGIAFIQKPIISRNLVDKIQKSLDA
jgi:CheY-like chemotaxis protein